MKTLQYLESTNTTVPMQINWQIGELMEYKGKQELYTHQTPEKLKALREHALIESAISFLYLNRHIKNLKKELAKLKPLVELKWKWYWMRLRKCPMHFRCNNSNQLAPELGKTGFDQYYGI